jgi:hypothetical protein
MQQISSPPANRIGGEPTMLSMPLRAEPCDSRDSNPFGAEAPYREVTVIFTTAAPARRARTLKELGNGRSRSSPSKRGALLAKRSQPRGAGPREADSTGRSNGGGIRTRIAIAAKYPKSSPPANERQLRLNKRADVVQSKPRGSRDSSPVGATRRLMLEVAGERTILGEPRPIRGTLLAKRSQPRGASLPGRFHGTIDRRRD